MAVARRLLLAGGGTGSIPAPFWTVGTLSAGGSPVTITNDSVYNAFPGVIWLDPSRILTIYRKSTDHTSTDGRIVGKIGTKTGTWTFSWGTEFVIYDHASLDVRTEDGIARVDGVLYISGRHFDGSDNQAPFILICDDIASAFTSTSTWTKYDITMSQGSVQNYTEGYLHYLDNGSWLQGVGWDSGGTHTVGVAIVADPTDWSAPTFHTVATGINDYSEIALLEISPGVVRAHLRSDTLDSIRKATSSDSGATWSSISNAIDGHGYPMFRQVPSSLMLSVYRDAPNGDTAWRQSSDTGATWSSETVLDTTGTRSLYATYLQLDSTHGICVYAIENSTTDGDIRSQIFTDSSTGGVWDGPDFTV